MLVITKCACYVAADNTNNLVTKLNNQLYQQISSLNLKKFFDDHSSLNDVTYSNITRYNDEQCQQHINSIIYGLHNSNQWAIES